jgi:hypothetical protein
MYIIALNEDVSGDPPDGADARSYAEGLNLEGFPVTIDPDNQVYDMTPWTGQSRPGKCALAPDMTMLACWVGEDDTAGYDAIRAHAGL